MKELSSMLMDRPRTLICMETAFGSPTYHELVRLRDLHLRQPIGLRLHPEDLVGEEAHRHFALIDGDEVLGGLIAVPRPAACWKLRQMWVHPSLRQGGHGSRLLLHVEGLLAAEGAESFELHARENAVEFYRKNGYSPVGGLFTEVGRPHQAMVKSLD